MQELKARPKTKDIAKKPGEMVKPAEIIGIPGMEGWTLADRRTWNLLLMNAWSDRLEDPAADFTISLRELRGLHDSNDRLRRSLKTLQTTLVEAHMPDGALRTVQMLGGTDINDSDRESGILKYDFHRKLVPLLRASDIYARMEVKVLSAFTSKYSLALYEAIAARINLRRTSEELEIRTLRQWLGVEEGKLGQWAHLQQKAVKPAVDEVNAFSPYEVEIEPIKQGKKVARVRVTWAKKEPFSPAGPAAAREVNRCKVGRTARIIPASRTPDGSAPPACQWSRERGCPSELPTAGIRGEVETVIRVRELTDDEIMKGYKAAAPFCRIDKHAAYSDWRGIVEGMPVPPSNPVGHFVDFCKKRAAQIR